MRRYHVLTWKGLDSRNINSPHTIYKFNTISMGFSAGEPNIDYIQKNKNMRMITKTVKYKMSVFITLRWEEHSPSKVWIF